MNAVVTVAIGRRSISVYDLSRPFFERYAARLGVPFICIQAPKVLAGDAKFEKLQLFDLMDQYERILYLDSDAVILPSCPNLFDLVPSDCFGAYFDSNGGNGDAEIGFPDVRGQEINMYQELCGEIGWAKDYFNSGVMLASRLHRAVFDYRNARVVRSRLFVDQTMLNYRVQKGRFKTFDLGPAFNHFAGFNRSERLMRTRFQSHIIHYAGFEEFYGKGTLLPQMKSDTEYLNQLHGAL